MLGLNRSLTPKPMRTAPLRSIAPLWGRLPWWLWAMGAVLASILATALIGAIAQLRPPAFLAEAALEGPRSPTPIDVVLLLDESGSFADYAEVRRTALDELTAWAPSNLRPDDTVTILGFAGDAATRLSQTKVSDITDTTRIDFTSVRVGGTSIRPVLEQALSATNLGDGRARTLIAVTDTLVDDADPARAEEAVEALRATSMSVILPTGVGIDPAWHEAFAWQREFTADPASINSTTIAIAGALAHATGQRVVRVDPDR